MAIDEQDASGNTILLPNIFDDTLSLLLDAHEYFQENGADAASETAEYRALYSSEMSRITLRISSVMAWLMIQKAVFLGKLSHHDVSATYDLESKVICFAESDDARALLPAYMNYLLDETRLLYERISRLEDARVAATPRSTL